MRKLLVEPRTLEGTWEEIALHGGELAGRKVRVTVLDESERQVTLDKALAHLILAAESLSSTLPELEPSHSTGSWSDGVDEKYRRQGFSF